MALIFLIILVCISQVRGNSVIVEYRFSKNFGSIIHDYSRNKHYAKNIAKSIFTDRGAFSNPQGGKEGYNYFSFPPHTEGGSGPSLYPSMTIALWSKKTSVDQNANYLFFKTSVATLELYETTSIYMKYGSAVTSGSSDTFGNI